MMMQFQAEMCKSKLKERPTTLHTVVRFCFIFKQWKIFRFIRHINACVFVDIVKRWHTVNCMNHIVYHFLGVEK